MCREWNGQEYMGRTLTMNIAEEKPGHAGGSPKWKEGPSEKPVRQPRQAAPHRLPIPRPPAPLRRAVASAVAPSCNCPDPCWCFVPIRRAAARASWATSPGRWRRRTSLRSSASAARSSRCASRPTARPATSRASVRALPTHPSASGSPGLLAVHDLHDLRNCGTVLHVVLVTESLD